ncbi:MAG: DegT/DnrJ/EryC1/StrS family aminotransferase [Candidatus Saccharimonadales bacterium]
MSEFNIPYTKHDMTPEDVQAVVDVLESGVLTGGKRLDGFEKAFADTVDAPFAVGVSSGSTALHLAVNALGIESNQTVLVPSLTFAATANAVLYSGASVEFLDVDPKTLVIDPSEVEKRLASDPEKYAGVIAVDFAGYPTNASKLAEISSDHGVWFIEDASHALGASSVYEREPTTVGDSRYADATVFSFHPAKHITTGEGGMVTTRSEALSEKIRLLRSHAMDKSGQPEGEGWRYGISELGFNFRMSEINAALGLSQLQRIDDSIAARQVIADTYRGAFDGSNIQLPEYDPRQTHANHLFVVRVDQRKRVYNALKGLGIHTQVHYVPLHMQPLYEHHAEGAELPHTEEYYSQALSIPMFPSLSEPEQEYVIESLLGVTK